MTDVSSESLDISSIRATVAEVMTPFQLLIPILGKVVAHHYNPYERGFSDGTGEKDYRAKLQEAVYGDSKAPIFCMVTSIADADNPCPKAEYIVAAHILPSKTTRLVTEILEMSLEDIQSVKNGLFLCKAIQQSFDNLSLSFVPIDLLHPNKYKMVIWKEACKKKFVIEGRGEQIGAYENSELNVQHLRPFRRALSYQAFLAHDNLSPDDKEKFRTRAPDYFGIPLKGSNLGTLYTWQTDVSQLPTALALEATLMTSIKEERLD